ncbi:MAG: crotonase/enoyl-CoA hydratase family protein [Actinomycetota bacterium]|nr:crotonase/enoyl-CoA hydratase family protein [Acidimicrobiales bacterium]MEC9316362.1 crotonase/enoyl-CoA hydratase family protein [Actinomycetota bacterium]MED5552294.1 crotonase/enoyl-CoA hydratase family protein [Actinomycetota bacterium]
MSEELVLAEKRDHIQILTLNRPADMNAFNTALASALGEALETMDADPDIRVGVLTGAGRGFSAGMDLKQFADGGINAMPNVADRGFAGITEKSCAKPLIAAVEGFALAGGLEVALSCDLIVASEGTKLGIPEAGVGLFAGAGALLRLPRQLPYSLAMEMALTADPITAEVAHQHGMVNRVVPKGEALDAALVIAERISKNAPKGVRASKKLIKEVLGVSEAEFWNFQRAELEEVFASEDAFEGATAFAEKRSPNWQDK